MAREWHVAVVGGGASGLAAAIAAASHGSRVTLLEAQSRVGRKLLSTGNGRCNLTNTYASQKFYYGADPSFVVPALSRYSPVETVAWFRRLGVWCREEEGGRVYPVTGQASGVLDALRAEMQRLRVDVRPDTRVCAIRCEDGRLVVLWRGGRVLADRVIVTAGGSAAPHLGGSDSGVRLLKALGHTIRPARPALVPLTTAPHFGAAVKGIRARAGVRLVVGSTTGRSEVGEVQFTEYGLSGIPVMNASLMAGEALSRHRDTWVELDLAPESTESDLYEFMGSRAHRYPELQLESVLAGIVHKRLVRPLLDTAGEYTATVPVGSLSPAHMRSLSHLVKCWRFRVTGTLSWTNAQVMAGGVCTREFTASTMESCRIPGLYAAGELLDITGECGGYNLHWAWASGRTAGTHAAGVRP